MEASLKFSRISTWSGQTVQFNPKGSCKERFVQYRTMFRCQADRPLQNGRAANFNKVLSLDCSKSSTLSGKMVQFNPKGGCKEKFLQHRTMIRCQADRTKQNGRAANFYEVLSLDSSKSVGFDEIRKAYRCKALKFHPDACHSSEKEEATRRFLELRKAYETLSDPESRERYDHELCLDDVDGRTRPGVSCSMGNKVWERQIAELNKRSMQKMEKRKKMGT